MTLKPNTPPESTGPIIGPDGAAAKGIIYEEVEHARITALLEKATKAISRRSSPSEVNAILLEFSGYALNHFREEVKLMDSCAFPGLEIHKQEHEKLAAHVRGLLDVRSKQEALTSAVEALAFWLDAHLRIMDKELFDFLQRKAR